ncbi:MAG: hypothetical protein PX481_14440, partial [Microcystis sp. M53603_WE2]
MKDILMLDTVIIINSDPPAYRHPPYQGGQGGSNLKSIFNLFGSNSPPLAAYNRKMSEYIHKSHNVSVLLY